MRNKTNNLKIDDSSVQTKDGKLILDSHKLSNHYERIEAWENGEKIAPVSVDMALSSLWSDVFFLLCNDTRTTRESQYKN